PFAGHPTLGSCHAWLRAGGRPWQAGRVGQQCAVGLVTIRQAGQRYEVAAPPLRRTGPLRAEDLGRITAGLRRAPDDGLHRQWVDNGPGWCALMLPSAERVLALKPDWPALVPYFVGVVGASPKGSDTAVEVRAFMGGEGAEDPVTGSLNASLAQWMIGAGLV